MATQVTIGAAGIRPTTGRAATADRILAGLLLFSVSAAFLLVTTLTASIAPAYDFHGSAISDLGVSAETAVLFNGLLVVIGVLNICAGYVLYRRGRRALLAIYVLAGIGAIGAGLFPLSTGGLHSMFALVAFIAFNFEVIGSALLLIGPMRLIGIAAGAIGLVYAVPDGHRRCGRWGRVRADRPWRDGADDRLPGHALAAGLRRLPDSPPGPTGGPDGSLTA